MQMIMTLQPNMKKPNQWYFQKCQKYYNQETFKLMTQKQK